MSVRCNLLGHDTTKEEREVETEDGVSAVKTVKKCERCGAEETVHEKKRVSIAEAESEFHDDLGDDVATQPGQPAVADGGQDNDDDEPRSEYSVTDLADDEVEANGDAVFIDDDPDPTDEADTTGSAAQSPTGTEPAAAQADDVTSPESEDAILMGNESPSGAETETVDQTASESGEQEDFDPDAFNASTPTDEMSDDAADDGGEILVPDDDPSGSASSSTSSTSSSRSSTSTSTSGGTSGSSSDDDLHCDTCRFSESSDGTPIRVGDICPNCKQGYITQS